MSDEIWRWDAVEVARAIRLRKISSREAAQSCLDRLAKVNPKLNAVTVVLAKSALKAADAADKAVKAGEVLGPLHGVPVTIKENVDQEGETTPNGVVAFRNLKAKADSPPVANWKKAGAVIIGRTNTPAFSVRYHTENALRGRTYNPWAKNTTPGGSSGGAGSAVAAGIGPLAHGNDYGGSIRYPAYACGVAGIRPTLGRVPAFNPTASEERPPTGQIMSVQGPLARRVRDVRLGLAAMAARDPRDPWWVPAPLEGPPVKRPIRVALTADPGRMGVHRDVAAAVKRAGKALAAAGYEVEEIDPPHVAECAETWRRTVTTDIRQMMMKAIESYGDDDLKRSLALWEGAVPRLDLEGYMREISKRAGQLRAWQLFFETYPIVVGPVSTEPPFTVGFDLEPGRMVKKLHDAQRLLVAINHLGLPATAVPVGATKSGIPLGVQVIAGRYREDLTLDAAEVIEAACGLPTPIDPRW
ncbi:MAG: amidase [Alphaproteobacteria bacterium]|nr:amidase [Alphaproteobacteria bacterium]